MDLTTNPERPLDDLQQLSVVLDVEWETLGPRKGPRAIVFLSSPRGGGVERRGHRSRLQLFVPESKLLLKF